MLLDQSKHKSILIKILKDIYTDSTLGPILGFKGGTAAYLFYDLTRFSVDLDFDLLDFKKDDYVFERLQNILETYGTIKEARKKRFNLFYILSYEGKTQGAQNIKVEINRRDFGSHYEVKAYLGISMKVMTQEDMAAHKLVAMFERIGKTHRDIFDVWFFLQNEWPVNQEMVEKRTQMIFKNFLQKCIDSIERMKVRSLLSGMGELLDEQKKVWVKAHLKNDVLFLLKARLEESKSPGSAHG